MLDLYHCVLILHLNAELPPKLPCITFYISPVVYISEQLLHVAFYGDPVGSSRSPAVISSQLTLTPRSFWFYLGFFICLFDWFVWVCLFGFSSFLVWVCLLFYKWLVKLAQPNSRKCKPGSTFQKLLLTGFSCIPQAQDHQYICRFCSAPSACPDSARCFTNGEDNGCCAKLPFKQQNLGQHDRKEEKKKRKYSSVRTEPVSHHLPLHSYEFCTFRDKPGSKASISQFLMLFATLQLWFLLI